MSRNQTCPTQGHCEQRSPSHFCFICLLLSLIYPTCIWLNGDLPETRVETSEKVFTDTSRIIFSSLCFAWTLFSDVLFALLLQTVSPSALSGSGQRHPPPSLPYHSAQFSIWLHNSQPWRRRQGRGGIQGLKHVIFHYIISVFFCISFMCRCIYRWFLFLYFGL